MKNYFFVLIFLFQFFGDVTSLQSIGQPLRPLFSKSKLKSTLKFQDVNKISPSPHQPPMNVVVCVEPTPFSYISGYANRFKEMLNHLHKAGDKVAIVSPDPSSNPPTSYLDYPIFSGKGFPCPMYSQVTLTLDFARNIQKAIKHVHMPDIIHVSSPSFILWPAKFWSWMYNIPLVISYHTNTVEYAKSYLPFFWAAAFGRWLVRIFHAGADLTLATSPQLAKELEEINIGSPVDVWMKGINTEIFNPKFNNPEMRSHLTQGHPSDPLFIYVGRLGKEKKLERLKKVLRRFPGSRLALIGSGPYEDSLKQIFKDEKVFFAGPMQGINLSQAFASSDLFLMPSDTETLGFVVLEAMASGVPVVGVRAGGLVDIIQDGITGYLAENSEEDGMNEFCDRVGRLIPSSSSLSSSTSSNPSVSKPFPFHPSTPLSSSSSFSSPLSSTTTTNNIHDKETDLMKIQRRLALGRAARDWSEGWSWEAATWKLRNQQYPLAIQLRKEKQLLKKKKQFFFTRWFKR